MKRPKKLTTLEAAFFLGVSVSLLRKNTKRTLYKLPNFTKTKRGHRRYAMADLLKYQQRLVQQEAHLKRMRRYVLQEEARKSQLTSTD